MARILKSDFAAAAAIIFISVFYWLGVASVPFHPDESTYLYMAADFKTLFTNPGDLIWQPGEEFDLRQYYREVDPPLTRYLIGLGLAISGEQPLDQDWDWGKTWQENQLAGALPSAGQLTAGRLSIAFFYPITLLFAYLIGKKLHSRLLGWISMALLASNALVLIHTRRAMAESILLFGVLFCLLTVISWKRQRFWLAIPVAVAFNAKYTALPFVLIGLIAVLWDYPPSKGAMRTKLANGLLYGGIFLFLTAALNPFLWRQPVAALQDALALRQKLLANQSQTFDYYNPEAVLDAFDEKAISLLSNIFFSPPAVQDIGNYSEDLLPSSQKYLRNPLHRLTSGWVSGALMLLLSLSGLILWIMRFARTKSFPRDAALVLLAFFLQFGTIFAFISFPFQRYYIPLTPISTLLAGFSIIFLIESIKCKRPSDSSEGLIH